MVNNRKSNLFVDGKPVRKWLFARVSALSPHPVLYSVEGFTLDHAFERLTDEIAIGFARRDFEMLEELDPEHDIGMMGEHHPLIGKPKATH
jgi:hypothetical protein